MDGNKIKALLESKNVAEELFSTEEGRQKLDTIGATCKAGFDQDLASRSDWEKEMEDWTKLAKQVCEQKTYPWAGASNVKYPLLSTAAMQFAARAYPSLVPSDRQVVKARPIGKDPDGAKTQIAEAVSMYMSYQLMDEMDGWEEDMDRMLIMLPIVGVMFKKTYWDPIKKVNCSRLVLPKNLVVDYWTRSLCEAERISEIISLNKRKVKERQLAGLWLDQELGQPTMPLGEGPMPSVVDDTTPYEFIEQHTYLDLDEDDYPEPFIVTFERQSGKVMRIAACFDQDTMTMSDDGEDVIQIERIEYYTKYGFIPSPDGGFYDVGFGTLLGPINESVNTLINQLIDAGHLSSLQGGFLGKGLRLRMGETKFKPGEWKVVNATGDDLKKQIVPLPIKEPSGVLLQLMGSLITSGKELASVAEIFVGKMPGQNTPATTTMATIEQGMKVFTAVYKRIYRSLGEEFIKLYRLNAVYLNPETDVEAIDMKIGPQFFDKKLHKIYPGADPTAISQTEKLMKAQGLMELLPTGVLDPVAVVTRVMEAQEQPNYEQLLSAPVKQTGQLPPQPNPKMMEMQMHGQLEQQKAQVQMQTAAQKSELEARDKQTQLAMKAQEHDMEMQFKQQKMQLEAASEVHKQRIFSAQAQAEMNQSLMHSEQQHQVALHHAQEAGNQKVAIMKKQAAAKPKPKSKGPTKK
jgi:chaperonin GroES